MALRQFITTVYLLAIAGRWDDLREYLSLVRELISTPTLTIVAGTPKDKEV